MNGFHDQIPIRIIDDSDNRGSDNIIDAMPYLILVSDVCILIQYTFGVPNFGKGIFAGIQTRSIRRTEELGKVDRKWLEKIGREVN